MSVERALHNLQSAGRFRQNITRWEVSPARPARYAPFPSGLAPRLLEALARQGIEQLYLHQAEAVAAALRGEHVVVATAAASGKTLCFNLPVLQHLLADPRSRALYLYPTKALAHDQLAELQVLSELLDGPDRFLTGAAYDGDTPSAQRARIRADARIVLSNPDMLHAGILPQHPRWAGFLAQLRIVVLDEAHVYRGVFGSHVANVLRRLRRICHFYGSTPQFILASATIANPRELAERLVEAPVTLVGPAQDGAPRAEKHLIFYNPPVTDPDLGIRRSSSLEAADLASYFLEHDVQTIVFARARLTAELILTHVRDAAVWEGGEQGGATGPRRSRSRQPGAAARSRPVVRGYRGGYLPSERRQIEQGLREGSVRGVVATNALELGIDIGRLDAAVLAGYPGTVASTRQQLGRAGRRQGMSAGVLVAGPDALDQYVISHPEWLLYNSPEQAIINPDNDLILAGHLSCAAAEIPLRIGEPFGATTSAGQLARLLDGLAASGRLYGAGGRYFWGGAGIPAAGLSLRSTGPDRVVIQARSDAGEPKVIGEVDRASAPLLVHQGAVYLHEGATYLVEELDWEAGVASVRSAEVDFYTRPVTGERSAVLAVRGASGAAAGPHLAWGDVRITSQVSGFRILRRATNEMLGLGAVDLPPQILETQACWISFPPELLESLRAAGAWLSDENQYGPNWPQQRDAARMRDGFRCQSCGAAEASGRRHDVHHKVPLRAFLADAALRADLPPEQAWVAANRLENLVTLCPACHRRAEAGVRIRSGLGGLAALLAGAAPLFVMCDPRDLGVMAEPQAPETGLPTVTLYERTPGGIGYAEQLFGRLPDLFQAALERVRTCPCERGCPACVGPVLEHEHALDTKGLTRALLVRLCDRQLANG